MRFGIAFNATFKAKTHILSAASMTNGMNGSMFRNIISSKPNVVLMIYKILMSSCVEHCTLAWSLVSRHRN